MIDTTLSHFRVTARLGAGGMGEVWRAQDTRLGRDVAVKVLPERFVADPERLARFEREARVLASLSHPSIAAIYETGSESGMHFLVMELAAGETLAERIARGPVPVREAMAIALQMAEALEAAHERGIVHRDLKPGNVMVDVEGRVKLLDFGLARALEAEPGGGSGSTIANSPTLSLQATVAGMLLGTAAYMSPEQAAGRPADRRADIWAFGVVLMEMLGGGRVYDGESVSHVLAAVLKDEPPWSSLPADTPSAVRELLERCLRKDPRRRLQSIGDARLVLEEVLAGRPASAATAMTAVAPARAAITSRVAWAAAAVAALAAIVLAALLARDASARRGDLARPALRVEIPLPLGTTLFLEHQRDAIAVSPDGRRQVLLVHAADGSSRLVLRDLGELSARALPGTEDASSPVFSPDGESVAFFAHASLWRLPVAGGPASVITAAPADNRGLTWSEDGYLYAAPDSGLPLERVRETGGTFAPVTRLDGTRNERTHRWPHALPGGKAVLFTCDTGETTEYYDDARIEVVRPATGERKVLVEQASRARFTGGYLVFARGGSLFAAPFDPERLVMMGTPVVVLQGVATTVASGAAHYAVADNGTLLYVSGEVHQTSGTPVRVDRQGNSEPLDIPEGFDDEVSLSPDGARLAVVATDRGASDIWVADLARKTYTRLTFDGHAAEPTWSPDGRWIAYGGAEGTYRMRVDGGGASELLAREGIPTPDAFSPDGKFVVLEHGPPSTTKSASAASRGQNDLWLLPISPPGPERPLVQSPANDRAAAISHDGRWLAYVSEESGRSEVYVRPFPDGVGRWQVSTAGAFEPRWSGDGRELFFRDGLGNLLVVAVEAGDGFAAGPPQRLFSGMRTGDNTKSYGVEPDGQHFVSLGLAVEKGVDRVNLVLGWDRELARLLAPHR